MHLLPPPVYWTWKEQKSHILILLPHATILGWEVKGIMLKVPLDWQLQQTEELRFKKMCSLLCWQYCVSGSYVILFRWLQNMHWVAEASSSWRFSQPSKWMYWTCCKPLPGACVSEISSSVAQRCYDRKISHREEDLVVCWIDDRLLYLRSGFDSNFCKWFLIGRDRFYSLLDTPSE